MSLPSGFEFFNANKQLKQYTWEEARSHASKVRAMKAAHPTSSSARVRPKTGWVSRFMVRNKMYDDKVGTSFKNLLCLGGITQQRIKRNRGYSVVVGPRLSIDTTGALGASRYRQEPFIERH